jgi:hypothetical protein
MSNARVPVVLFTHVPPAPKVDEPWTRIRNRTLARRWLGRSCSCSDDTCAVCLIARELDGAQRQWLLEGQDIAAASSRDWPRWPVMAGGIAIGFALEWLPDPMVQIAVVLVCVAAVALTDELARWGGQ